MEKRMSVKGRLHNSSGQPIKDAIVMVAEGTSSFQDIASVTNDSGEFYLSNVVVPGHYTLHIRTDKGSMDKSVNLRSNEEIDITYWTMQIQESWSFIGPYLNNITGTNVALQQKTINMINDRENDTLQQTASDGTEDNGSDRIEQFNELSELSLEERMNVADRIGIPVDDAGEAAALGTVSLGREGEENTTEIADENLDESTER